MSVEKGNNRQCNTDNKNEGSGR